MTPYQPTNVVGKPQRTQILRANRLMADPADILGAILQVHPDFLGGFKGDDLANIME